MSLHPAFPRGKTSGFTLIEVLVVVAGGAIVLGLTVPTAMRFYQNQLVDDTARTLKDTFRRAQIYAMADRNSSSYGIKVLPAQFVLFQGASYASRTASQDELIDYPPNLTVTGTSDEFVFSQLYATSSVSGTVSVVGDAAAVTLGVNAYGKIELQ